MGALRAGDARARLVGPAGIRQAQSPTAAWDAAPFREAPPSSILLAVLLAACLLGLAPTATAVVLVSPAAPVRPVPQAPPPREAWRVQVDQALGRLAGTATGRPLAALVRDGVRFVYEENGSLLYMDGEDAIYIGPQFLDDVPDWQLAVMLGHELEHARQQRLGLRRHSDISAREAGAFLVQCRVWVELGGRVIKENLAENAKNSQDMAAWTLHPWAALAAIGVRTDRPLDLSGEGAGAYFRGILEAEAAWRLGRRDIPTEPDADAAASFILRQAGAFASERADGRVSDWLAGALGSAAGLAPGASVAIGGEPSGKDLQALATLPFRVEAVREGDGWRLRRP